MEFNEILNQKNKLTTEIYFDLQRKAFELYGPNAVVFIEIGTFFEIYQSAEIGLAQEIANSLNIMLTRKNKSLLEINEKNPHMCGIPTISMDKHLDRLIQENKWTIIFVTQKGEAPNISREIDRIISPGTNIDFIKNENNNFIASVFNEKVKDNIIYSGLTLIDLSTGKVLVYENYGSKEDKELSIDEIKNLLKIHSCNEIILTFEGFEDNEINKIKNNLISDNLSTHIKSYNEVKNLLKISYQNEILKEVFETKSFLSPIEELDLEKMPNALNSLIILIDFISDHNVNLIKKLKRPELSNNNKYLYIGNNALEQLNIINLANTKESLSSIVNNGITAIGKRFIYEQLTNPLINKKEILDRYINSNQYDSIELMNSIKTNLKEIYDIERLWRKIKLGTIAPNELHNLYTSLKNVINIENILQENNLLNTVDISNIQVIKDFILEIEDLFILEKIETFNMNNINESFVKKGFDSITPILLDFNTVTSISLKKCEEEIVSYYEKINTIGYSLNKLLSEKEYIDLTVNPKNMNFDSINIGYNDTEGYYYEITNKRLGQIENLKNVLESIGGQFTLKSLKSSKKIYFEDIAKLSNNLDSCELQLIKINKEIFKYYVSNITSEFEKETVFIDNLDNIILMISKIEFYINNNILKNKFSYTQPEIIDLEENFVEAIDLRHAIIERINDNSIYIPNDLILGNKKNAVNKDFFNELYGEKEHINGLLLYGLNSSGKSSYTKSLGIAIILAQAGFFVPAKYFRFSLFESIFTRITGSDNIYKGLSTFAIEMLEMKNIFNRANEKTLILGDEIAHGTETISALSIVSSAVNFLANNKASFIFATHLHQLKDIEEVSELKNVSSSHLEVLYDEDTENLIYNRKIKSGQGSSIYGLEFAKFMQMNSTFLKQAYSIRKRLSDNLDNLETISLNKKSRYNKNKIICNCSICGKLATEEHHINEQHTANDQGMIDHIHKNHKSNLVDLCEDCHKKVHKNELTIEGWVQTGEGRKLIFN